MTGLTGKIQFDQTLPSGPAPITAPVRFCSVVREHRCCLSDTLMLDGVGVYAGLLVLRSLRCIIPLAAFPRLKISPL
jgi:hypothetical protein